MGEVERGKGKRQSVERARVGRDSSEDLGMTIAALGMTERTNTEEM